VTFCALRPSRRLCEELPDALLLIDPSAHLEMFVAVSLAIDGVGSHIFEPDRNLVMVYRENDFLEIINQMKVTAHCFQAMLSIADPRTTVSPRVYELLHAEPLFETSLLETRKARLRPAK
jgi:hypothetical protein